MRGLPEEPRLNACIPEMSVAENMALRQFDEAPYGRAGWLNWTHIHETARRWIGEYGVKTPGAHAPISALSGGNVQRAVLARELSGDAQLILVSNPTFGLDFAATADIHARVVAARNRGAAVLLISEDLDEILQLADRVAVVSEGRIVHECPADTADRRELGTHMAGGHESEPKPAVHPLHSAYEQGVNT